MRVVTYSPEFAVELKRVVQSIADKFGATSREYVRPGNVSDKLQHTIVLNSTLVRRALFDDGMKPNYDAIRLILKDYSLSAEFHAGLSDEESCLLEPVPIDSPHWRVFAVINSDRKLLGIARRSLVRVIRLEPSSVRIRLASHKGRRHTTRGIEFVTRRDNYALEVLSGAKKKWLAKVGTLLWHPSKASIIRSLLATYR